MAWERGYYYRVLRANGQVKRQYIGSGRIAELVARLDAAERQLRELEQSEIRRCKEELRDLDACLQATSKITSIAARAAMLAAGFHQHRRGEWRKRRGKGNEAG